MPLDFKVVLFTIKGQKIATQNLYSNARSVVTANPPSMSVVTTESSCQVRTTTSRITLAKLGRSCPRLS